MEEKDRRLIEKHIGQDDELKKYVLQHQQFEKQLDELGTKHFCPSRKSCCRKN